MSRTRTTRAVAGLITALALVLLGSGTAYAHDVVTGSDPAEGSSIATAPDRVTVTLDNPPQGDPSVLTVTGPDGQQYDRGPTTAEGTALSVPVALGPAGEYQIGYRIVSSDGHPITGAIPFTLTAPGPAAAAPAAATPADPARPAPPAAPQAGDPSTAAGQSPAPSDEGGVPAWPFALLAVAVIGGAAALVLRRRPS